MRFSISAFVILQSFLFVFGQEATDESTNPCDELVPEYCMLPYPSDFWRVETAEGSGEYRLNFHEDTFPIDDHGLHIDPVRGKWNDLHGYPVMPAITTYFPRMDESSIDGCARWWNMEKSEDISTSLTVLLDTVTMKQVPHWVELDHSSNISDITGKHALLIWPTTALEFDRRYIVGIKPMLNKDKVAIKASDQYVKMVNNQYTHNDGATKRQQHYNSNIFNKLREVGIEAKDLIQAWDFTTNTKSDVTGRMIHARDDSSRRLSAGKRNGPEYRITSVELDTSDLVGKRIKGEFRMPTYLNTHKPIPSARLVLDNNSRPIFQSYEWYRFEVIVPKAFVEEPGSAGILQYGHGLFGNLHEVEYGSSTYMYEDATDYGYILCASTWLGLSEQDIAALGEIIAIDVTDFQYVPDRTTQGMINALGLMKLMKGDFMNDPVMLTSSGASIINPDKTAYMGNSEGGIFGSVYMSLTQDVTRGCLGVPGGPYSLLLPRSLDFGMEFDVMKVRYSDPVDRINLMQVLQMLWDRAEPAGYMSSINKDLFPDTPKHEVILHYGLGDAQVSWLGAHAIARSVDAVMYASNAKENNENFYGFELLDDVTTMVNGRSAIQGFDYMSPQAPIYNKPPLKEGDTHECPRKDDRAQAQMGHFFLTGEIKNTCGGTCIAEAC